MIAFWGRNANFIVGGIELFLGLVYCANCGRAHQSHRANTMGREQEYFLCGAFGKRIESCTAHHIRTVVLERVVLEDIRSVSAYAGEHEDEFVQMVMDRTMTRAKKELSAKKKKLEKSQSRISELNGLFTSRTEVLLWKSFNPEIGGE